MQMCNDSSASLGMYAAFKADAWGLGAILYYAATGAHLVPEECLHSISNSCRGDSNSLSNKSSCASMQ